MIKKDPYQIKDFQHEMTWYQVKIVCSELENGWRIPTNNELNQILKNRKITTCISKEWNEEGIFWTRNTFNINQFWKFTIREWRECSPAFSTHAKLLMIIKS